MCRGFFLFLFIAVISACGNVSEDSEDSGIPVVSVGKQNGKIILNWNVTEAVQYRVLYSQGNDAPQEHTTKSTTFTLPPISAGTYTIFVEAYDALGNSVFSVPVVVVVS